MSIEGIHKYGYGLLKLDRETLMSMDLFEFIDRVNGALLWHEHQLDETLNNFAWYTANLMLSSGNFKKGANPMEIKKSLYVSIEDHVEEAKSEELKRAEQIKNVNEEKARLIKRFGLDQN
ncbi:hypothetical protein [Bacillus sp. NPDC077027]|uniref:hypothetical protein n=1 Tax=Bacillus sp. NPDC077027 TaxID=3390548 RepID=UPI003CFFAD12